MKNAGRFLGSVWAALMFGGLVACGGGSTPSTPSTPLPTTPPPTSVVVHDDAFPVGSKVLVPDTFSTSATGTLVVTLDWTFASNDIDIFVAWGTEPCTLQTFNDRTCPFIATEESATLKPEKLTIPNLPAGAYTLYVANFGATDESVACHIVLTSATSASISSVPVGRGASNKGAVDQLLTASAR